MKPTSHTGRLFINDQDVGEVAIRGWQGSWGIGSFAPVESFEPFRPLFAEWARLMHADDGPVTPAISQRLRALEYDMYRLHCRLFIQELGQCRQILILNIDGPLIEWKEGHTVAAAVS